MEDLFIDCPTGLAGDMLLAGFIDLGVPLSVIKKPLSQLGFEKLYLLTVENSKSNGLRGLRATVESLEGQPSLRVWGDIKHLVASSPLEEILKKKILDVFQSLAEAEATVHGINLEQVHFHEIGAIDSLVDIIGVCASLAYLKPSHIYCSYPCVGSGSVETSHGILPVPVPAVLELARKYKVKLLKGGATPPCELTTPTGLALMINLADSFGPPSVLEIEKIGIGLGSYILNQPNFLRICLLKDSFANLNNESTPKMTIESIGFHEAWIDDATPEDISFLKEKLINAGAIDVISQSIQMKKGRNGITLKSICKKEDLEFLRSVWFSYGPTLGLRERVESRWKIQRRRGKCLTSFGEVYAKQAIRPDGRLSIKPEHDCLVRLSLETGKSLDEIRHDFYLSLSSFEPCEDWEC